MPNKPILPMVPTPQPGSDMPLTEEGFKFAISQSDTGTVDRLVDQMMAPYTAALAGGVPWYTLAYTSVLLFVSLLLTLQECFPIAKGIKLDWMIRGIQVVYIKSLQRTNVLTVTPILQPRHPRGKKRGN